MSAVFYDGPIIYAIIGMAIFAAMLCAPTMIFEDAWRSTPWTRFTFFAIMFWVYLLLWPIIVIKTSPALWQIVVVSAKAVSAIAHLLIMKWRVKRLARQMFGRRGDEVIRKMIDDIKRGQP
jgi:hypothetical protein